MDNGNELVKKIPDVLDIIEICHASFRTEFIPTYEVVYCLDVRETKGRTIIRVGNYRDGKESRWLDLEVLYPNIRIVSEKLQYNDCVMHND